MSNPVEMRFLRAALSAALLGALLAPATPTSATHGCTVTPAFEWCGDHPVVLPLRLRVNATGGPFMATDLQRLAVDAMDTWNRLWLAVGGPIGTPACPAICIDPAGNGVLGFRSPLGCGAPADAIAVACLTYAGPHRIARVDVYLDPTKTWRLPTPAELAGGEAHGFGTVGALCTGWWDPLSAIVHEFGHAVGLDDLRGAWPSDLTHAPRARQTMYFKTWECSTHKRTPEEGDVAALALAAAASRGTG